MSSSYLILKPHINNDFIELWNKGSEGTLTTLTNIITQIQAFENTSDDASTYLAVTSFGIPLTGSMAAGFTVGFIKGG